RGPGAGRARRKGDRLQSPALAAARGGETAEDRAAAAWPLDGSAPCRHASDMGLTIDLAAIAANWTALARQAPGARPGAVVKADAYGLGAAQVAPALYEAGARDFFVALASEGRALRPHLAADARIFILSGHMEGQALDGLIPVLNSPEQFFRDRTLRPRGDFAIQL